MTHMVLQTIEELLDPANLSRIAGQLVTRVDYQALTPEFAKSGSRIARLTCNDGAGPSFILKRVSTAWDWLMRATDDHACRSMTLWSHGVLDGLPPLIDHTVLACARDGAGWAILMRDVSPFLYVNKQFSAESNLRFVEAMVELHAAYLGDTRLGEADLALCTSDHIYGMFAPRTGRREAGGPDELPRLLLEGWAMVGEVCARDVADLTLGLLEDLAPLRSALARYPHTLVHGDFRHANLGLVPSADGPPRVALLDWQLAAYAPPAVELGRYLGANAALLPNSKEQTLAAYEARLATLLGARFSQDWWRPQLALGLLGGFVQDGWAIALKATHWHVGADTRERWRADLHWWSERVREGAKYL